MRKGSGAMIWLEKVLHDSPIREPTPAERLLQLQVARACNRQENQPASRGRSVILTVATTVLYTLIAGLAIGWVCARMFPPR